MKSNLVDVEVQVHHQTTAALLVSPVGTSAEKIWLPLSQIEAESTDSNEITVITLPEWLALEKELI